ncbi:cyclopropane-fatty-acyl-phospholipid synthase [Deferribacter desulfuricans SSM1]|uniref:Cyclopropane-fatty-acyl-phospholipid synthase n=1 Tax=Deferribacter desulfuricans (strain DSM 14783 / JCM 11476 / NBRC 101012 / SSM1) TaxID=639282 RepID=D3PEA9_DEFDS|nr:cyclopropane fatty acyl phospholipid synthase [Deferribacter desulfuricans]BAI80932.1 cyclopropane-fatty-acyl-phospholipid synthase [Deferribacter desulfuricans SSM1]
MDKIKAYAIKLLNEAGITVNGNNPWDIKVHNDELFREALLKKNLALGEGYMQGWWDCQAIDQFICKILKAKLNEKIKENWREIIYLIPSIIFNKQNKSGAKEVAERHYNLGNELFENFLDPYMQYSCAYFLNTEDLAQAQINKMELICRKLELKKGDKVLDIGCGWGGLAKYMVEKYGCNVVGINISEKQIEYAKKFCKGLPVEIINTDYRDIKGVFDKIVSVGMFEHVGPKNYRTYMKTVYNCLKDDGIFLLHTIGSNESEYTCDPWIDKYIFPNGTLPSISQIAKAAEELFVIEDLHNMGPHYDKTLLCWNRNFQENWNRIKHLYDETFKRMWEYYLLSSAGGFRARHIQLWQIVMTKEGRTQPYNLRG